jgi:hypothetical protein
LCQNDHRRSIDLSHATTMAPPPRPFGEDHQHAMPPRPNRTPAFLNRMGLYEKGLHYRAIKEEKIRLIRDKMMENCTFTPNTIKSQSTKSTQYASSSQSSHSPVWDRLYPAPPTSRPSPAAGTKHARRRESLGRAAHLPNDSSTLVSHRSRTTLSTATSSSLRIEQLYEHGRSKLRNRPLTDRAEAEWRRQRYENEQLKHCTFQPRTTPLAVHQSRRVTNLLNDAKEGRRQNTRPTQPDERPKDSGTSTISISTPQHGAKRWNHHPPTTTTTGRRGARYPSEITVVTRPRTPAFDYSSPPEASPRVAPNFSAGHRWREDARARSITARTPSPHQPPEPASHLWRTPSPSPPRPPPLPPTRRRLKRENDDFMVDLSSFCDSAPPTLQFDATFAAPGFPAGQQRQVRGGGAAVHPFHSALPQALPKAVPDSVSHTSTISTEYGSI